MITKEVCDELELDFTDCPEFSIRRINEFKKDKDQTLKEFLKVNSN